LRLAETGADLSLVRRDAASLQHAMEELAAPARRTHILPGDMGDPVAVEAVCRKVLADLPPVHILINNVGGRRESVPVESQSPADWQRLMDLNLTNAFPSTKVTGGAMLPGGWGRGITHRPAAG